MQEAEAATAQLDAAFENTGKTVGLTRARLDTLATEIQRTTTVSDDLVKQGEAILLTFDRVRGEAFERTLRVATDLSARLGTDLKQSIRQVGLALQDPVAGLTLLRRSGISFNDEQKNLIKGFLETNQAAKAQALILGELERRFGGSAAAARNTLGGALTGLKNAFGDLFEGTRESTSGIVTSINSLSATLSDPRIKEGIDTLITGFTSLVEILIRAVALIGNVQAKLLELAKTKGPTASGIRQLIAASNPFLAPFALAAEAASQQPRDRRTGPYGGRGQRGTTSIDAGGPVAQIEEINVTARKLVDENGDLLREMRESTRTEVQRISGEFIKLKTTLQFLRDLGEGRGGISGEEFQKRLGGALDDLLPEFDLNEIRAKYITLKKETTELGEFMKGVWQGVGRSIQATLSDAIYEWNLSWKSLIDIARRALADIASAIITSGIKKLLAQQLSGGGGDQSLLADSFFAFLGASGAAGGGRISGATVVGEDGPEMVFGKGYVMNKRQMAFAGMGGASVTYAPQFNLNIQSNGDKESERRMAEYVESRLAQSQGEFTRLLGRSGVEVKG
jgi:hypothetical protein